MREARELSLIFLSRKVWTWWEWRGDEPSNWKTVSMGMWCNVHHSYEHSAVTVGSSKKEWTDNVFHHSAPYIDLWWITLMFRSVNWCWLIQVYLIKIMWNVGVWFKLCQPQNAVHFLSHREHILFNSSKLDLLCMHMCQGVTSPSRKKLGVLPHDMKMFTVCFLLVCI
jgi:hypothetical protein